MTHGSLADHPTVVLLLLPFLAFLATAPAALAQGDYPDYESEYDAEGSDSPTHGFSGRISLGFIASPDMFSLVAEVPYAFNDWISVGPRFQIAFANDDNWIAPTIEGYLHPPLGVFGKRWHPYLSAGMGFGYLEKDGVGDDVGLLFTTGVGLEYEVASDFFIGTNALLNILPNRTTGEHLIFGWQVLQFRLSF